MTIDLESELRRTLTDRAASVPADSAMRLQTLDFQPRTTRFTTRLRVTSLAGVAAGSGAILSVALLGGSQPAFAGWSAVPSTTAAATPPGTVSQHCLKQLQNETFIPDSTGSVWTPVITDVRGPYTFIVYENGNASATCFDGQTFTVVDLAAGPGATGNGLPDKHSVSVTNNGGADSTTMSVGDEYLPPNGSLGGVQNVTVAHLQLPAAGNASYTVADGQIASGVSALSLQLSDGSTVQTTTGGGWFVAWWPSSATISTGTSTTPAGQQVEHFGQWMSAPAPGSSPPCNTPAPTSGAGVLKPAGVTCQQGTQSAS